MDGKQKLEELVAGLDGVTTGPWKASATEPPGDFCIHAAGSPWQMAYTMASREGFPAEANAAHIARCDPNTIRSISDAYKAMKAERDALRAEAGELVVAQYRISALEAAISRQVENIERWMETGKAAGPEESKSIYEQMKAALAHATGQEGGR